MPDHAKGEPSDPERRDVTSAYKGYVLVVLTLGYVTNSADRNVLAVVQELLKQEFHLADWQLGLLGGLTFSLFYSILGIPIARLAERASRVNIIAVSMLVWSAMTAFCGLASSVGMLALCRLGVGVGEAGGTPPSHSIIVDYFSKRARAAALAVYSSANSLGVMLAAIAGGWIATHYGWREVFLALGVPGVILAVLVKLTVREPQRPRLAEGESVPSFRAATVGLLAKGTFRNIAIANVVGALCSAGIVQFTTSYFMRTHELPLSQATLVFGLAQGVFATLGTLSGGLLASRLTRRFPAAAGWVCAASATMAGLVYALTFSGLFDAAGVGVSIALIMAAKFFQYGYMAPSFAMMYAVAHERSRATAMALMLLLTNLFGVGLGPMVVGALSDISAAVAMGGHGLTSGACIREPAASSAICMAASAEGLQLALLMTSCAFLLAMAFFLRATVHMRRESAG